MVKEAGNNFFQNEFIKLNSRDCKLLLEFNEEGFSYSIFQNSSNKILYTAVSEVNLDWYQATEDQLTEIFNSEEVFKFTFGQVVVLADTINSTLVPKPLYEEAHIETYLKANLSLPIVPLVYLNSYLDSLDYVYIYVLPEVMYTFLKNGFLNVSFLATEVSLLQFLNRKNVSKQNVNVHLGFSKLHFAYFEGKELKFSNSFTYQTNEDLLYNILNVYKQLGLSPEKVVLNLSGAVIKDSNAYDLLYKYIKSISFQNRPLKLNYSERLDQMPEHYFMHHYAALL